MLSNRIKLDEREKELQRVYLNDLKDELYSLYEVEYELSSLKSYLRDNGFSNEFGYTSSINVKKIDTVCNVIDKLKAKTELVYDEIYSEIDFKFYSGVSEAVEKLSRVNINDYYANVGNGIKGRTVGKESTVKRTPLSYLEEGEVGLYDTNLIRVDFMDLIKSNLTREMKISQYNEYAKDIGYEIAEARYEQLIDMMYRSSEFSYLTGTEKIVNFIDTSARGVLVAALVGSVVGVAIVPGALIKGSGYYLTGKNIALWWADVDVNGNKLTEKEREMLQDSIITDVVLTFGAWGLSKIYADSLKNVGVNVVDDIDDITKGSGNAPEIEKIRIIDGKKEYNVNGKWITESQFKSLRRDAVANAWEAEVELVKETGKGTRNWTQAEMDELLANGKVSGYEGQHMKSATAYPDYAGDPDNIQFLKGRGNYGDNWVNEHLDAHGGNWSNPTNWHYDPEGSVFTEFGEHPPFIPKKR